VKLGVCISINHAAAMRAAGWDFIEENVQNILQGLVPDDQWKVPAFVPENALPISAANCLVPGSLKITGPDVDPAALERYVATITRRAAKLRIDTLVLGSGAARNVPDGFDRAAARRQTIEFARRAADDARQYGMTLVIEPLNRGECNLINTVAEAMDIVTGVDRSNCRCLVDSYHFWLENDSLADLQSAMPSIGHVHLADKVGRTAPGISGQSDYRPLFAVLKHAGYDGRVSVEALGFPSPDKGTADVAQYIRREWQAA
jgi:sugar phosphate isomerase/epimerase